MMKTIKTALSALSFVAMVAGFSTNASAYSWTLSPDANALAFSSTVIVGVNQIGFAQSQTQPIGMYGAVTTVNGGASQSVYFDADLYTFDSINFDQFIVSISTLGSYWDVANSAVLTSMVSSLNTSTWSWGGVNFPGLETYVTAPGNGDSLTLNAVGPSLYYVSVLLNTQFDTNFASWGSFHVAVPEPSMLALLGIGLLAAGVAGRARRKNVA